MNAIIPAPLTGELLPPDATLRVVAAMHPLKTEHQIVEVPVGSSLAEIVGRCAVVCGSSRLAKGAVVTLGGEPIAERFWHRVRPKTGSTVVVRAVPGKGAGGILKSILSIALLVVATAVLGPGAFGFAGLGLTGAGLAAAVGVVSIVGSLALNALFPTATTSDKTKKLYSIAGAKNEIAKWGPIPVLHGQTRVFPKYAASPYTEFDGDDQYVRMLFVWGLGPMQIGEIRFGETPLSHYEDVEVQTFEGYPSDRQQTIYPGEVIQDDFQIEITREFSPHRRYTGDDAAEVSVDYIAPQGIYNLQTKKGTKKKLTIAGRVELRNPDTGSVVASQPWNITSKSVDPIRRTLRFKGLPGDAQYEVFFVRDTQDYDDDDEGDHVDTVMWTAIRTVRKSPPIEYGKPLAITAIRIKATKQLNGVPDEVNAVCTARVLAWNGNSWVSNQPSRNPADIFRLVLQGPGNARPVLDNRLDLATIQAWHDYCAEKGFTFDIYRDFNSSVSNTLRDVCAAGRAVPLFRDGKWSVAWEEARAPIVQHFTPRNSRDFSWTQTYRDLPHALRVKFVNASRKYVEDERLVYDDGYTKLNASLFEQVEFPGVQDPDLIFKHARYRIAEGRLRTAVYKLTVDFEHLVCTRGDRVRVAHDVIEVGLTQGRISAVAGSTVTIDEDVFMEAGKAYAVTIRRKDGSSIVRGVTTQAGWHDQITLSAGGAEEGALFMFGTPERQTSVMRVRAIRPGDDLSAELELVDDAPGIQDADTGPITGDPGTVVVPPPLAEYRPFGLSAKQFLDTNNGITSQITRIFWQVKVGGPALSSFLVVATDDEGKEFRSSTADGNTFSLDYVNLPTSDYTIVVQGFTADGRYTGFSNPFVLSQTLPETGLGVDFERLNEKITAEVTKVFGELDAKLAEIRDKMAADLETLAKEAAFGAIAAEVKKETDARTGADGALASDISNVKAIANNAAAAVNSEAIARSNADGALGSQINSVLAVAQNAQAGVSNEATARANGDNALASQINAVLARTDQVSASGFMWLQAIGNGPNGLARFSINLNAGTQANPGWVRTGFIMEAGYQNGGIVSRVFFMANQFAISNGSTEFTPFFVQDGRVYMDTAFIRELHATKIIAGTIDASRLVVNGVSMDRIALNAATELGIVSGESDVSYTMFMAGGLTQILTQFDNSTGASVLANFYASGVLFLREYAASDQQYYTDGRGNVQTRNIGMTTTKLNLWGFSPGTYTIRVTCPRCAIRLSLLNARR